ncbi:uncharacterized protein LOC113239113 [Hyposmocoma kahamanoa]|uniref:uncharacterized protein LOC113239113 n=1 Tax=Hyposmocoma kahamanoa TaxID=1477025 RepID=UPI000E6DA4A5|nr:uncharacterized protein LOC113239113 [Hyposmocoma kahamanoa]
MGDFNTDLMKNSMRARSLKAVIESVALTVLPLEPTHHNVDASDTWLDLILASSIDHVGKAGQFLAPGFSRHDLIYLSYKIKPLKAQPVTIELRSFARLDMEVLKKDAQAFDWGPTLSASTVDEAVFSLNSAVLKLFDTHAPIRSVKLKRPPAPWITRAVRIAMTRRDRAFRKYKRDRCEENWLCFKAARNRCNQMREKQLKLK